MKIRITGVYWVDPKIFNPNCAERTKLDYLNELTRLIREGKGVKFFFLEHFEFLESEIKEGNLG